MSRVVYPAILERGASGFGVYFPDLPVVSGGDSEAEAFTNAAEALQLYLDEAAERGLEVPAASRLDQTRAEPGIKVYAKLLVEGRLPGRATKVTITLDEALLERIDRAVAAEHVQGGRSGFLAESARQALRQTKIAGKEPGSRQRVVSGALSRAPSRRKPKRGSRRAS